MNRSRNICRAKLIGRSSLHLVGSLGLLLATTVMTDSLIIIAQAQPVNTAAVNTSEPSDPTIVRRSARFWSDAEKILAAQSAWLAQATAVDINGDPAAREILRSQLRTQLRAIDLFIQRDYHSLQPSCPAARSGMAQLAAVPELDLAKIETYCAIYQLRRTLTPLQQQLAQLPAAPPPPSSTPLPTFRDPQMVGIQRMKQLQAGDQPLVMPAVLPSPDRLKQLSQVEAKLVTIQASLPRHRSAFASTVLSLAQPPQPPLMPQLAVPPAEQATYQAFLTQPQTGIDRVYPTAAFAPAPNRLRPNNVPLPFGLRLEAGQFLLGGPALNYGFIAEIGNVDLDDIRITQGLPALFSRYTPPTTLAEIQYHQRRFLVGKDTPLGSEIPAKLNHTYVMRLLNYQLPELVTTGRPLQSGERGQLRTLLNYQSSDRLIAFRPVKQQDDGSYTILWKVLDINAAPKISDLENYVNVNLNTRSWR